MDSNYITSPAKCIVKPLILSDLTNKQLLKRMQLNSIEEHVSPYSVDMNKTLSDEQPLISIDGIADLQRNTNDLEESNALVGALMSLSTKTNVTVQQVNGQSLFSYEVV